MGKSWPLNTLLLLAVITVTRGQYYDILQGLQQLFQPYQGNDFVTRDNAVTRNPVTQRQEAKKKTNVHRHQNEDTRRTKKPPVNQYDYIFATTQKPSRKTTKPNSSQSNSNPRNNSSKNQYSNVLAGEYYNPFESTTKAKVKAPTTTTEVNYVNNNNDNGNNRATTENVFSNMNYNNRVPSNNFNINRPVAENVFENVNRGENYAVAPGNVFENTNNRRPVNFNNNGYSNDFPRVPNNQDVPQYMNGYPINNNQGNTNGNNDRGILNTDYNNDYPSLPTNTRNPNVFGVSNSQNDNRGVANNDRGIPNNNRNTNNFGLINTDNDPGFSNNFGSNAGSNEYNRDRPNNRVVPNEYDRRVTSNNFGNTGVDFNKRGNINMNNRGPSNNFNTNDRGNSNNFHTNDRGNTNNFNTNNRGNTNNFDPNRGLPTFNYPSDNPLINRPGVQPAHVEFGQPPITNRPVQSGNNFVVFNRPTEPGSITYDEGPQTEPDILIGPDEDDMSEGQKRRYVDLAERMCHRYKSLTERKIVALPLVPSPNPVELNVSDCTPVNVPLVIGGKVVSIRDFPHMALVGWTKIRNAGYSWKCGGSLISNQYILTAGHCTYQDKDYDVVSGPPQAVQLGSSYLDDPGALVVKISAVIRHPKYKMRRAYHDIALIKMVSKVTFSEVIRPACLGVPPPEGDSIIATGWGRTEFGGDHSLELRSVSLPVWDMEECREIWGTSLKLPNGVTADSHVCAGEKRGGKDTCQGDSGGPAQTQEGCQWRVVAVTSYGRSCGAPHTPALYAIIPIPFVAAQVFTDQR